MRPRLPIPPFAALLVALIWCAPAAAQDRAYWWEGEPRPAAAPYGLLLLGEATPTQRRGGIRGFLQPLGVHDLPAGRSEVPLLVPVRQAGQAPDQTRTEWSDAMFLNRFWDAGRDAAERERLGLAAPGPWVVYRHSTGTLAADLGAADGFWMRHWILAYRRAVAAAPTPEALAARLKEVLPEAPVALTLRR
jgi:hypothetical protein